MANQLILDRALDANGYISPGAKATIYADGTSTLITVYSDVAGTIAATNPIVADGDGFWPQRFVTEDAKAVVTTSADVPLYTLDPCPAAQGAGAAASQVSFSPTVELPQTNVQDAIVAAAALSITGVSAFGVGVTGNSSVLANLDATGTASGAYRFDGSTTGTYPTGVVAADTGVVETWRETSGSAVMWLYPDATPDRAFFRRMAASTWGTWRQVYLATASGATQTIWLPAGSFTPTTTNGAAYASQELATNDVMVNGYDFSASTRQNVQTMIAMPKSWNESTVTAQVLWKDAATAGTGDVIWGVQCLAVGNDDAMDTAFGTAQTATDTFIAAGDLHIAPTTAAITASGSPAEGDLLIVQVYRDANAGGDTYTQLARFIGVRLFYTINTGEDN